MKKRLFLSLLAVVLVLGLHGVGHASLLAHWTFDETSGAVAHDSGPSQYDGNLQGDATFVSGGKSGNAVSLTEAGRGLVNMGPVLNYLPHTSYTISAWVKTPLLGESNQAVVTSHTGTVQAGYILGVNTSAEGQYGITGGAWFYNRFPSITPHSNPGTAVVDDTWHLLTGVHAVVGMVSLYVDGVFQQEYPDAFMDSAPPGTPLLFGGYRDPDGFLIPLYTGLIDDVQFYNTALTGAEIMYLNNHPGSPVPLPGAVWLLGSGLVGLASWRRLKKG